VNCDRGLIGQCLTNLLQNAADAIDGRREHLDVKRDEADCTDVPPGRIRVSLNVGNRFIGAVITDNGAGLPKEGRDRLTDPYVTNRKKGTGLGLAIVKKIAEQHGGELTLNDAPETSGLDGAQVTLRLPKPALRSRLLGENFATRSEMDLADTTEIESRRTDG
jgi:two-component system nitrogen regulation sensor histidine kinase NtrY